MLQECLVSDYHGTFSMENFSTDGALKVATINATKTPTLKASLKDFRTPIELWEHAAQDQSKWRCLTSKEPLSREK